MSDSNAECGVRSSKSPLMRGPHSRGFTLIEVLLALAILAVVVTEVYRSFSAAAQGVQQAEEVRDGADMARTLLARLTNDLANAYVNHGMRETFLYGRKSEDDETKERTDGVFFTTFSNWRRPDTREMDLWEVGYYFQERPEEKKKVLLRREKRELSADVPPLEGGVEYELTDQVKELRIRYYTGAQWTDEWPRGQTLPKAVEVALRLADDRVYATQVDIRNQ